MNARETMALAFAQTLLALPKEEFDVLKAGPDGPLESEGDGYSISKSAVKLADALIAELAK